jgi:hypothetical protein
MPPFKEEGVYFFAHVGLSVAPSTKWFPDDNSRTLTPRIMKLHWYIDHYWQMTPIDFQVIRSKVKVTVTKNVFTQWLPLQLTAHMGGMHVLQTALVFILKSQNGLKNAGLEHVDLRINNRLRIKKNMPSILIYIG